MHMSGQQSYWDHTGLKVVAEAIKNDMPWLLIAENKYVLRIIKVPMSKLTYNFNVTSNLCNFMQFPPLL